MALLLVSQHTLKYAEQGRKDVSRLRSWSPGKRHWLHCSVLCLKESLLHPHAGQGTKGGYSTVASQHGHSKDEPKGSNLNIEHTLLQQWQIVTNITASKTKGHYPGKIFSDVDKREVLSNMATKMSNQFFFCPVNISIPKPKLMACMCAVNALL